MSLQSRIDEVRIDEFSFFVKRDDLLGDICGGNKARKLEFFIKNAHKFAKNTKIISFGSSQSNALAVLSEFARQNGFECIFVCEKISNFLKQNPCGNYALALKNGAKIIENLDFKTRKEKALSLFSENDIFINEGIACKEAQMGFQTLAKEIKVQSKALGREFDIFLPAGTGVSALYLAKFSKCRVFTCACVGDENYLKRQMLELEPNFCIKLLDKNSFSLSNSSHKGLFILKTPKKFHFAKPHKELLNIYQRALKECEIEFSLLYDSVGLHTMLFYKTHFHKPILYIHQGGLNANASMLERYKFKGLL